MKHRDGSFDEYYPSEHGYIPTSFSLFAAIETCRILELTDEEVTNACRRAARYLARHEERWALNQAAALPALYGVSLLSGDQQLASKVTAKFGRFLGCQHPEGWFEEYGGADLGYGIDMGVEALQYADADVGGRFATASAEGLPSRDGVFDKVVFTETWLKTMLRGEEDQFQKSYREDYTAQSLVAVMAECRISKSQVVYTNFFLTEILLGITKLAYAVRRSCYNSRADLTRLSDTWTFKLYKAVIFPLFFLLGRLEALHVLRWMPGHFFITGGTVSKNGVP